MLFKQRLYTMFAFILLLSIVLAGSQAASQLVVHRANSAPPADPTAPGETPQPTPETAPRLEEYTNENFGVSLSIPEGYEVQDNYNHSVIFLAPQGTQGHRERGFLNVELAGDLTAEWLARQVQAENAGLGTEITSAAMTLAGQTAYILGHLPGQDLNRQVFVVYQGYLYRLTFMPDNPQEGEAYQQMESLYSAVIHSLHFLPDRLAVPPVISESIMSYNLEQAVERRSEDDILGMLGEEFKVLDWTDSEVTFTSYGREEAAQVILEEHVAESSNLEFFFRGWPDVVGSPEVFINFFSNESVFPVQVKGWGPDGSDEAVVIFSRRRDGSLFWRGVVISQGAFVQ